MLGTALSIASWLTGSAVGRKVALSAIVVLAALYGVWRIYAAGKAAERARATQASLDALRKRVEIDNELSALPAAERRKRLERWVLDDGAVE